MTSTTPPNTSPSSDAAIAREIVAGLIEACRDCEHAFELAAHAVREPMLRAELMQYSRQRREFAEDLHEAIRTLGEDVEDRGSVAYGDKSRWEGLERAAAETNRAALLIECERHDLAALDAYRDAIGTNLPYSVGSVIHSQLLAITRVENRLRRLADGARGSSPIDNPRPMP